MMILQRMSTRMACHRLVRARMVKDRRMFSFQRMRPVFQGMRSVLHCVGTALKRMGSVLQGMRSMLHWVRRGEDHVQTVLAVTVRIHLPGQT